MEPAELTLIRYLFQSTLPREERHMADYTLSVDVTAFQSTLPREERPQVLQLKLPQCHYFNPRSHERSDSNSNCISLNTKISIHAPTRGATINILFTKLYISISIHAPTRGATTTCCCKLSCSCHFNPRSHERSDSISGFASISFTISIHAPTRGATYVL